MGGFRPINPGRGDNVLVKDSLARVVVLTLFAVGFTRLT